MHGSILQVATRALVLGIAMLLPGCCHRVEQDLASHRPDARTLASLMQVRARLQAAMNQGDRAALEQLLDDAFVFVHSTGKLEPRGEFIDRMALAGARHLVPEIEFTEDDIRLYGHTAVWVSHSIRRGTSISFVGTDVLVETAAGWRWVSVQSTRTDR